MPPAPRNLFRFATFEADAVTGELRKSGMRIRLQAQPFQFLLLLLERPGVIVTREEMQQRLWPGGTFVDFDHGLNTAANKLRSVLGDSPAHPVMIETVARSGYRFLLPVTSEGAPPPADAAPPPQPHSKPGLLTSPHEIPAAPRALVRGLFLAAQAMYLIFYIALLAHVDATAAAVRWWTGGGDWALWPALVTAAAGIPLRLYLLAAVGFQAPGFRTRFLRIFPVLFLLDALWAAAPLLLVPHWPLGWALAACAALVFVPFAQRTLVLMGAAPL